MTHLLTNDLRRDAFRTPRALAPNDVRGRIVLDDPRLDAPATGWRDQRVAVHPIAEGPQMLTAAEAADRLGVKLGTLYAYVSRGWLKSYKRKVGREALYRRADIEALRGVIAPERGVRARSLPDASSWVTVAQPPTDG